MIELEQEDTLEDILSHQTYYVEAELGEDLGTLLMEEMQSE